MAIIKLKSGRWQATYQNKAQGIARARRNFDTKREAQEWEAAARANAHNSLIGRHRVRTFGEALARYLDEVSPAQKTHAGNLRLAAALRWPVPYGTGFIRLADMPLEAPAGQLHIVAALAAWRADMRRILKRAYIGRDTYHLRPGPRGPVWYCQPPEAPRFRVTDSRLLAELDQAGGRGPYSPDTLRTRQALVKSVLRECWQSWEWTTREIGSRIILEKPAAGRELFLDPAQLAALLQAAQQSEYAEHLAAAIAGAALVGWRRANLLGLTWERVHFPEPGQFGYIVAPADETKSGRPLAQPMSDRLQTLLAERRDKAAGPLVFHRGDGHPFGDFRKTWQRIKAAAGIDPAFRWHDLRHTWASRLIQAGATDRQLMELGGWSSPAMPQRYAHLRLEHLQEIVNK